MYVDCTYFRFFIRTVRVILDAHTYAGFMVEKHRFSFQSEFVVPVNARSTKSHITESNVFITESKPPPFSEAILKVLEHSATVHSRIVWDKADATTPVKKCFKFLLLFVWPSYFFHLNKV